MSTTSSLAGNTMEPLDFQSEHRPAKTQNVAGSERMASVLAGGAIVSLSLVGRRVRWLPLAIGGSLVFRGLTGHCSLYHALGVNTARSFSPAIGVRARHGCKVEHTVTIQRPAEELFAFWRKVENLPRIMRHIESVKEVDNMRSHWVAKGPVGSQLEWDAEIINEREPELLAWRSLPGSQVDTAGSIHFKPLARGRGTLMTVSLKYDPPGGKLSAGLMELLDLGLDSRIREDLRCFKNLAEAGEIPTTEGQPHG